MSRLAQAVTRAVEEMRAQARRDAVNRARKGARRMTEDNDFDGDGDFNAGGEGEFLDQLLSGDPDPGTLPGEGAETSEAEGADGMAKKRTRKAKRVRQAGEKLPPARRTGKAADRTPRVPKTAGPKATAKLEDDGKKTLFITMPRQLLAKALKAATDADRFTEAEAAQAKKILQRIAAD